MLATCELEQFYLDNRKYFEYTLFIIRKKGYTKRNITKKNGNTRELNIPLPHVKNIQSKINKILNALYSPPKPVHGFILKNNIETKSIISNAKQHINKTIVINLDIENFFGSFNFGRVRGVLLSNPMNLKEKIATRYAQLLTYENKLPQGAPTSPVMTNIICKRLDHQLIKIAKKYRMTYSRYADDLTFSSHRNDLDGKTIISDINIVVNDNGFKLNEEKTRIQMYYQSQIVTGIKVNKKLNLNRKYIRQIRSMLYSWFTVGLAKASEIHFEKFNKQPNKYKKSKEENFTNILLGKINFIAQVKGSDDVNYIKFIHSYHLLKDKFILNTKQKEFEEFDIGNIPSKKQSLIVAHQIFNSILIFTEGETDISYIKSALKYFQDKNEFTDMNLRFVNLRGWVNVKHMYNIFYGQLRQGADSHFISIKKCIFKYLNNDLKCCFVLDSDDKAIIGYFKKQKITDMKNSFLLDYENKGYIEKLIDSTIIVDVINKNNLSIEPSKANDKTKKKLNQYLKEEEDSEIHSIDSYIVYKKKIITKVNLAKQISNMNNIDYNKFKDLFLFLETSNTAIITPLSEC